MLAPARAAPSDRITCSTVGIASGIAAIASATALVNTTRRGLPALRPEHEHDDHRHAGRGRDPQRQRVQLLRQRRLLACRSSASIPAILPTCVSLPVAVTIITPLPCVTGVCMNAMSV